MPRFVPDLLTAELLYRGCGHLIFDIKVRGCKKNCDGFGNCCSPSLLGSKGLIYMAIIISAPITAVPAESLSQDSYEREPGLQGLDARGTKSQGVIAAINSRIRSFLPEFEISYIESSPEEDTSEQIELTRRRTITILAVVFVLIIAFWLKPSVGTDQSEAGERVAASDAGRQFEEMLDKISESQGASALSGSVPASPASTLPDAAEDRTPAYLRWHSYVDPRRRFCFSQANGLPGNVLQSTLAARNFAGQVYVPTTRSLQKCRVSVSIKTRSREDQDGSGPLFPSGADKARHPLLARLFPSPVDLLFDAEPAPEDDIVSFRTNAD
jgi:hypothetical protein